MENHNSSSSPQNFCGCQCSSPCDCWKKSAPQMENKEQGVCINGSGFGCCCKVCTAKIQEVAKQWNPAPSSINQFIKETEEEWFSFYEDTTEEMVYEKIRQAYQLGKEEEKARIIGALEKLKPPKDEQLSTRMGYYAALNDIKRIINS